MNEIFSATDFFRDVLNESQQRTIVQHALHNYRNAPQFLSKAFADMLQGVFRGMPGFRNVLRATGIPRFQHAVYECALNRSFANSDLVVEFVIRIWQATEPGVEQFVDEVLEHHTDELKLDESGIPVFSQGLWNVLPEEYTEIDAEYLQLALLFNIAEGEEVSRDEDEQGTLSDLWQEWLFHLETLSYEAPEWDSADMFLSRFESLVESRRLERQAHDSALARREEIEAALASLREEKESVLAYFALVLTDWDAANCRAEEYAEALSHLARFTEKLGLYWSLHEESTSSLSAKRQNQSQMAALEEEIIDLHRSLEVLLLAKYVPEPDDTNDDGREQNEILQTEEEEEEEEEEPSTHVDEVEVPEALSEVDSKTTAVSIEVSATSPDETIESAEIADDSVEPRDMAAEENSGESISNKPGQKSMDAPRSEPSEEESEIRLSELSQSVLQPSEITPDGSEIGEEEKLSDVERPIDVESDMNLPDTEDSALARFPDNDAEVTRSVEPATVPEAALSISSSEIFWTFMEHGDIAGGYWLARSLESKKMPPDTSIAPAWLVAALFGSNWMMHTNKLLATDLLEIAQNHKPDTKDRVQVLLGLATAVQPVIMAPYSGMLEWLDVPDGFDELKHLIYHLKEFAKHGVALSSDDLAGIMDEEQLAESIAAICSETKSWLETTPLRRFNLRRAATVWRTLVSKDGGIHSLLQPVVENNIDEQEAVRKQLGLWRDSQHYDQVIDRIDGEITNWRSSPIVGAARNHIVRGIQEACDLAARWSNLMERANRSGNENWISGQIEMLRQGVAEATPPALVLLEELILPSQPPNVRISATYLRDTLLHFHNRLGLDQSTVKPSAGNPPPVWLIRNSFNLSEALGRRLLVLPELNLSEDQRLPQTQTEMLVNLLWSTYEENRTAADAIKLWINRQNYTFVEDLLPAVQDEDLVEELSEQVAKDKQGSIAALRTYIYTVEEEVEQAVLDGILAEQDRTAYLADTQGIQPEEILDFQVEYTKLVSTQERLRAARVARLEALKIRREEFEKAVLTYETEESRRVQIIALLDRIFAQGDTRIIDETLAQLFENPHTGLEPDEFDRVKSHGTTTDLEEFLAQSHQIENWLNATSNLRQVINGIRGMQTVAGIEFGALPAKRREEAISAIRSWERLKKLTPASKDIGKELIDVLAFLGFTMVGDVPLQYHSEGIDWLHVAASMTDSGLARPIPQYGTLQHGNYDVVILWDRPGADTIAARLRNLGLGSESVIVFYLGRLTERQRRDVARSNRDRKFTIALLDELILLFLGRERDARLPTFLRCVLPFAELNPYTPTGEVPTEMFFGREDLVNELTASTGSCIVYGGRQLGKSALLRQVTRTFNHPKREQYAFVEDIKLLGDPALTGQTTEMIWIRLRETLKKLGLLSKRITTDKPDEILGYVRTAMMNVPNRRVIAMFDEADNFLDADAKDSFRVVEEFRKLMFDTNRRFKVVLTGLHNVQRFQALPNQPLAHFGNPINIGPLSPSDAEQLVRQPLETLGYRFVDQSVVLRTISYTNYHPALIQLFCQKLLEQLVKRTRLQYPPYEIRRQDVEAVYRDQRVREGMRDRFDWTLALDMRYQAIAWGLIVEQIEFKDSYARSYTPSQIFDIVRSWWPQGFHDSTVMRSLLDEMVGLGVLVREQNGHYRLRSPNLVRLMGSETDIEGRLLDLISKQPLEPFDADQHHAPLDEFAKSYSPFTYAQERQLNQNNSGVSLIFGSEASGVTMLMPTFRNFIEGDYSHQLEAVVDIPSTLKDSSAFRVWLKESASLSQMDKRIIVLRVSGPILLNVIDYVDHAIEFCSALRSRNRWTRIIFVFDSSATWQWLNGSDQHRQDSETRVQSIVFLKRWSQIGIRQRLAHHQKMHTQEICENVEEWTGGWHLLLDELFSNATSSDDIRPIAETLFKSLSLDDRSPAIQMLRKLGLTVSDAVTAILNTLINEAQPVPAELLVPELIAPDSQLTYQECNVAVEYLLRMDCISRLYIPTSEHSNSQVPNRQQPHYAAIPFLRKFKSIS